jgi:hypothetical protein
MEPPIRILAIVPEPSDAAWSPAAAAAWTAITSALRAPVAGGGIEIVRLEPATSMALEQMQRDSFHVVHVVARGTSRPAARHGTITLEGSDGRARDLNAQNFARICARIQGLQLVVLQEPGGAQACLDVLRDAVLQHAASVVCAPAVPGGSVDPVEFARRLYVALVSGKPIDEAFAIATGNPGGLPANASIPGGATIRLREGAAVEHRVATPVAPRTAAPVEPPTRAEAPPPDADSDARRTIERKRAAGAFDVFLCHNVGDKPAAVEIGRRLMARGVLPWLDQWELRPGMPWQRLLEEQIANIHAAAVLVGREGIGPWQRQELDGFLREFNKRGCPVIPVLLPGAAGEPELPLFLRGMTWVDFRATDPDPLTQLIWGVTGQRPGHL